MHYLTQRLLLICLLSLPITSVGFAEPVVSETIKHYRVSGQTAGQVRDSLNESSPVTVNNRSFDASTERWIHWELTTIETDGNQCRIGDVAVNVEIIYTMPELIITNATPESLKTQWSNYYVALLRHEKGHGSISIMAARRIEAAILQLPSARTCRAMKSVADALASRIMSTYDYRDQRYDRDTGHGELEGALFPPISPL